jgi:tetratricopeptide (TPR) repeat protein
MAEIPELKIFLSSPGDVAEERALAEIVFRRIADELSDAVRLHLVIWEHEPLFAHTGFQQQIERPSQCDLVVCIIWSRLGTRLPADYAPVAGEPAPTGTEFEVRDALAAFERMGKPNLLIYRKIPGPHIQLGSADFAERTSQYARLDEFCRRAFYDVDGAVMVAHHAFTDSYDFERRLAEHVRRWLLRTINATQEGFLATWRGRSPFRGLQAFEAEHQAIFFGRSEAQGDLMRRIRELEKAAGSRAVNVSRLLLVQGMSGTGKTSLFKAGLLPLLELRPVEGIAKWLTVSFRPSESDPRMRAAGGLGILASRLNECVPAISRLGIAVEKLADMLRTRPQEAAARIATSVAAEAERAETEPQRVRLLIYIDQLEEAFAPGEGDAAAPLFAAIIALARSETLWVAATMRSDFAYRLEAYPELMQCLANTPPYTLAPPRSDELADMIREPARAAGLLWEERDGVTLDQALLRDAADNPESLPLLEYTLAELYERREGRLLRWSDYGGGLRGALIAAADEVVRGTPGDSETVLRDVMRELVGVGVDGVATRRYASLARFPEGTARRGLLDRLVARRLCVTTDEGRGDGPVTCLAHEALIRSWPMAQEWLKKETALLQIRDELSSASATWDSHGRADAWLGTAPEQLAAIGKVEQAGLMPAGPAEDYARLSRRRARRNTLVKRTAISGICLLTLIAGIAWWIALQQRDMARIAADTATHTKDFMVSLFKQADPVENGGKPVTAQELLKKGAADIEKTDSNNSLSGEPRVRAELLTAMGQAFTGLGQYHDAEDLLAKATTDENVAAVPDESRVRTLIASGVASYYAGDYTAAEKPLREAVSLARKSLDPQNILRSQAFAVLADELVELKDYSEAEQLCAEALRADRKRGPADAPVLATTLASLGNAYYYSGDLAAAEAPMREALALRERSYGLNDARTAESINNLGVLLYQSGRYDAAIAAYRQALMIYRRVLGDDHPEVATAINNIGRSALMAGHLDEAEPPLRQVLAMTEKFDGADHDFMVSPLNSLAMIDAYRGHLDTARTEIERAEAIARLPDHDELLDQVLLNKAYIELASGDKAQAAKLLTESKLALQQAYPNDAANAWRYAVWQSVNAELVAANGDVTGALSTLGTAQATLRARFGPDGFFTLRANRSAQQLQRP